MFMNSVDSVSLSKASIFGREYVSRQTFSFSFVRSTHILIFPFGLGTVTIPAHQFVGLSTFLIIPSSSFPAKVLPLLCFPLVMAYVLIS